MSDLRERVARAIEATIRHAVEPDVRANQMTPDELAMLADAALAIALEEAARVAEGPVYRTSGTGDVAIRGTDAGNWSVPQPLSGFKGSDYGTGRYDAAAAIRVLATASAPKPQSDA